jgi:hypothetical protein
MNAAPTLSMQAFVQAIDGGQEQERRATQKTLAFSLSQNCMA